MSPVASVAQALSNAAATTGWTVGMCGQFCAVMYGYSASGYKDALTQWQQTPAALRRAGATDAPPGALLYWGGGSQGHGHVAIAAGDGTCYSIDIAGAGTVTRAPVNLIHTLWGLPYLGWAVPFFQGMEWSPVMIYGVDVAAFQATTVPAVTPGDGKPVSFAFIKATEGTSYINPRMAAQAASARARGDVVGFYHFLHPGNIQAQCAYFTQHVALADGDLLAVDWETTEDGTHATNAEKDAAVRAVQVLRPEHKVLLYCNTSYWLGIDTTGFAGDGLWIATAGYAAGQPPVQAPFVLHQYSTAGDIDHDVAMFASQAAMRAWAEERADVALTQADIDAVAAATVAKLIAGNGVLESTDIARIFTTDGILASPADAVDHATNPYWAFATYVTDTGARVRAATATLDAILAQSRGNGSGISQLSQALAAASGKVDQALAVLAGLDLSQLPEEIAAKLATLKFVLEES